MKKRKHLVSTACVLVTLTISAQSAVISYSFWGYDQYAGSSPFYQHYQIGVKSDPSIAVGTIGLLDSGWGNHPVTGSSSYHVFPWVENITTEIKPLRTVGWHNYQFLINTVAGSDEVYMDGNLIAAGNTAVIPEVFRFVMHNSYGQIKEVAIDDFVFAVDGVTLYSTSFESPSLEPAWSASRLDAGMYYGSADTTFSRTGFGSLAIGDLVAGQSASIIDFDSTIYYQNSSVVPEPGSMIAIGCFLASGLTLRRRTSS